MKEKIELKTDTKYYYVETLKECTNIINVDISVFEEYEWITLLNMSIKFEKNVDFSLHGDYEYGQFTNEQRISIYYLYYCDFCKYESFSKLDYIIGNKYDYHTYFNRLLKNKKPDEEITSNEFRKWIVNNYENLKYYYSILPI